MDSIKRIYYYFTAYVPRRLPRTPEEYERFKRILARYFSVPDEPPAWITVSGQITATPGDRLRKPWGTIANNAKRLRINNLAMGHRHAAMEELNQQLAVALAKETARLEAEEVHAQEAKKEQQEEDAFQEQAQGSAPEIKDGLH